MNSETAMKFGGIAVGIMTSRTLFEELSEAAWTRYHQRSAEIATAATLAKATGTYRPGPMMKKFEPLFAEHGGMSDAVRKSISEIDEMLIVRDDHNAAMENLIANLKEARRVGVAEIAKWAVL